jgi:hypothetical protein
MVVVAIAEPARPTWKYFPGEVGGPDGGGDGDGEGLGAGLGGVLPPPPPQPASAAPTKAAANSDQRSSLRMDRTPVTELSEFADA